MSEFKNPNNFERMKPVSKCIICGKPVEVGQYCEEHMTYGKDQHVYMMGKPANTVEKNRLIGDEEEKKKADAFWNVPDEISDKFTKEQWKAMKWRERRQWTNKLKEEALNGMSRDFKSRLGRKINELRRTLDVWKNTSDRIMSLNDELKGFDFTESSRIDFSDLIAIEQAVLGLEEKAEEMTDALAYFHRDRIKVLSYIDSIKGEAAEAKEKVKGLDKYIKALEEAEEEEYEEEEFDDE
jgi:hypothetical protein